MFKYRSGNNCYSDFLFTILSFYQSNFFSHSCYKEEKKYFAFLYTIFQNGNVVPLVLKPSNDIDLNIRVSVNHQGVAFKTKDEQQFHDLNFFSYYCRNLVKNEFHIQA